MTNEDPNWPDSQIYLEGSGKLEAVTTVKEGAAGGDGATAINLTISMTVRTRNAVLMMGSTLGARATNDFFWDDKSKTLRVHAITGLKTRMDFGKTGGCFFKGLGLKDEIEAVLKNISALVPSNVPDCWDAKFGIYIRDPSNKLIADAAHALSSAIDFTFIQRQETLPEDDGD